MISSLVQGHSAKSDDSQSSVDALGHVQLGSRLFLARELHDQILISSLTLSDRRAKTKLLMVGVSC